MVYRLVAFLFFVLMAIVSKGQSDSLVIIKRDITPKINWGFNYHLQVSHLDVAPVIFYPIHKRIEGGVGLNYLYYYRKSIRQNTSAYGANVFSRVYFLKDFYIHLEYLYSNVAYRNDLTFDYNRVYIANFFAGLGYRQPFTRKVDGYLFCLVDITHRDESPYKNLIVFKLGVSF